MQNSDRELLNQHFVFHLRAERKALGRAEEGKGREMGGEIKTVGGGRGGGGNRQEWKVIISTLARGIFQTGFPTAGGLKPYCLSSLLSFIPFL